MIIIIAYFYSVYLSHKVAPGIDLDKDITSKMGFMPIVGSIKEMDKRIFNDGKMGIRDEIMQIFKK